MVNTLSPEPISHQNPQEKGDKQHVIDMPKTNLGSATMPNGNHIPLARIWVCVGLVWVHFVSAGVHIWSIRVLICWYRQHEMLALMV